jgi:hypothetical protein
MSPSRSLTCQTSTSHGEAPSPVLRGRSGSALGLRLFGVVLQSCPGNGAGGLSSLRLSDGSWKQERASARRPRSRGGFVPTVRKAVCAQSVTASIRKGGGGKAVSFSVASAIVHTTRWCLRFTAAAKAASRRIPREHRARLVGNVEGRATDSAPGQTPEVEASRAALATDRANSERGRAVVVASAMAQ